MVVGVVRDPGPTSGMSFRGVYLPAGPESPGTNLMLRVRGNPEQARVRCSNGSQASMAGLGS